MNTLVVVSYNHIPGDGNLQSFTEICGQGREKIAHPDAVDEGITGAAWPSALYDLGF